MNCQIAQNSLSAYLDRELPGDQMMALRSHVEYCSECQAELESLKAVKFSLGTLATVEPREDLAEQIMLRIRHDGATPVKIPVATMMATSVAAALLALLAFNLFFGERAQRPLPHGDTKFDVASDSAVTSPDFGSHAPLIPVGR